MVERYKRGDPMPQDPWLIRMAIKHPKLMAASVYCRKMGRIPVESGQFVVLCLPVDSSTLMYKSQYMPTAD